MSLLREIQNSAIDSEQNLASILRKCKVLSARLGSSEFRDWVNRELSGYMDIQDLPDYRICHVDSKGHFEGALGSGIRNANIPLISVPAEYRDNLSKCFLQEPVDSIENTIALAKASHKGILKEPWDPNFVAIMSRKIYDNMTCVQAWKVIPIGAIVGAVSEIRNRILNFVLDIDAQNPDAGEAELSSTSVP